MTLKRECKINDYMHKASHFVVKYCLKNNIGNVVIGNNKDWKQNCNMGKRNNQNFVSIPFEKIISMIQYKSEEYGINVIITEESYTSKVDHFANEEMCKHEQYLGKRVKRGLFKSSTGRIVNADTNGAIGILRKVDNIKQVRVVPKCSCFAIEIVYDKKKQTSKLNNDAYLSIDLGLNNLITSYDPLNNKSFVVNGRPLKSINQYYNKRKAFLM